MRRPALSSAVLTVVLLAGLTACTAGPPTAPGSSAPTAAPPRADPAAGGYADLVDRVEPSVVTVRTDAGLGSGVVFRPDVVMARGPAASAGVQE
ncbi:MAG: hypothetical protein ACRDRH_00565 [Pseudonocardia sp.]